jgi:hypothetical protein
MTRPLITTPTQRATTAHVFRAFMAARTQSPTTTTR